MEGEEVNDEHKQLHYHCNSTKTETGDDASKNKVAYKSFWATAGLQAVSK